MKKTTFILSILLCLFSGSFSQSSFLNKGISNALEFDGTDDYVNITTGSALFANLDAFSMCGWVYPTNPNAQYPDFDGYFGIKNEFVCDFYVVQINGTGIEARITTNEGTFTIDPPLVSEVVPNEWHHYALVYTGSELQLYLNGVLDGSIAASGQILLDNLDLTFGKLVFGNNDFYLDGKLDEITFWSKALTGEEINQYQCITEDPSGIPDLTAYYDFNEEEGLVLPDHFENYDGDLTDMNGDEWIESEVCESGYTIIFSVTDELSGDPLESAEVNLEGLIKATDASGMVEFTNYDPGTYLYEVTKDEYYEASGEVIIEDENVLVEVTLAPVLYYSITFIVQEDPGANPVDSAIINLDGALKYTNDAGMAVFEDYLPGNYTYNVSKEGYFLVPGIAEVIDENVTIEISLLINGVNNITNDQVQIYPNPASEKICIDIRNNSTDKVELKLINLYGQTMMSLFSEKDKNEIDLSGIPKGIYLFEIKLADKTITQPIIVL